MKIIKKKLYELSDYPMERMVNPADALFLDIETTGFLASSSYLYLIGCVSLEENRWVTCQWFAEKYEEEPLILEAFREYVTLGKTLIHFNGTTFDLPFLEQKCKRYQIPNPIQKLQSIDLYRRIAPFRHLLKLPNCKQKTLEQFLGVAREDLFDGGELIGLYHEYVKHPDSDLEEKLLLHNREDLQGMFSILPALNYYDLFLSDVTTTKVQANYYRDLAGQTRMELLMTLALPVSLPKPVSISGNDCYFMAENKTGTLKVPVFEEELKYFYANYKDYYYLPEEDVALHKSVGSFVDKEHRVQASASTCYTRKSSQYLPQWGLFKEPFFKRDYKSKELFFELTEEFKRDRAAFSEYANHILAMLASLY